MGRGEMAARHARHIAVAALARARYLERCGYVREPEMDHHEADAAWEAGYGRPERLVALVDRAEQHVREQLPGAEDLTVLALVYAATRDSLVAFERRQGWRTPLVVRHEERRRWDDDK